MLASWFGMMTRIHPSVYSWQVSEELFWAHWSKVSIFCNSTVFPSLFFIFASCEPTCPPVGLTGPCWWTLRFYFLQLKQFYFSTNHSAGIYLDCFTNQCFQGCWNAAACREWGRRGLDQVMLTPFFLCVLHILHCWHGLKRNLGF